ncbi:MAG: helix-turn-helix domain-containing protein [Proteobacteria bacterium]|nr:helix-turn-helix domain-containing protein [Pseudomonadota bacterium]
MENFINKTALADMLGISIRTLELWVARRGFPAPRHVSGSRLAFFRVSEVEDWLERELASDLGTGGAQ